MIAPASTERNEIDLKNGVQFFPVQHIGTFQGLASTMANTYRDYDIALRDSLDNARFMRNDCGVMMALESRMRSVALFPWHIEPENEHSPEQKQLCEEMTKIMDRIPRFIEFRKCLLEAIWFGKYGVQVKYGHDWIGGYRRLTIKSNDGDDCPAWLPVNGDKIVFRHDDASRYENKSGAYPFQVGIRVGVNYKPGEKIMGKYVAEPISQSYRGSEPIDRGMAYFLDRNDRQLLVIHKHMIEDGSYEDILSAGSIHGIGIRSRIYWDWVQCRETLGFLIAYLERTHGGIEIYRYPMGNMEAKREVERLITNREPGRGALMVPIPMGEDASQYGVEVTESGMGGIQQMLDLIENYYSTRITKYILGQELSSSAKATGLGSGVADLHLESLLQVLNYDATNLEETMTTQSLRRLQVANFPASKGINLKFKIDTEDKNQGERLNAINQAFQMGARIKESDVFDVVGLSAPGPNDRVLQAPGGGDGQPSGDPGPMPPSRNSASVPDDITGNASAATPPTETPERYSYAAREPDLRSAIDRAANATDPNPSDAQKVTGNYRKGQFHWNGWTIAIETPAGAKRRGRNALGLEWEHTIPVHYGYFRRTESEADGDHIDVFVGPEPESPVVFVVDQVKGNGHFDEHKVMIGFTSEKDAIDAYRGSYSPGWTGLRSIHGLTVPQFKAWMEEGDSGDPISGQVSKYARQIEFEWKEEDHPRDDVGRFAETESASIAKKPLKPGMVEMRQAKAGGETSEVDGKFYKGGQWLPVHGLYAGQEKPEQAENLPQVNEDPFAHLASEDGGKGRPVARERSREEVDRERQRMQEERDWQVVADGPLGRALHLGERPHGIRHTHGSLPAWTELARSGEVSDDKFDSVSEWAEQQSRKVHDEKERPLGGPGYDPGRKWGAEPVSDADWAWEQSQVAESAKADIEWVSKRNDRKILKQHPQVALARAWVSHLLDNDQSIETLTTLHRLLTGEGGGADQEPGEPDRSSTGEAEHEKSASAAIGGDGILNEFGKRTVHESVADLLRTLKSSESAHDDEIIKRIGPGSRIMNLESLPITKKAAKELHNRGLASISTIKTSPKFGDGLDILEPGKTLTHIFLTAKGTEELRKYDAEKSHSESIGKAMREGKHIPLSVLGDYPEHMETALKTYAPTGKRPEFGDIVETSSGVRGILRGQGGIGSDRIRIEDPRGIRAAVYADFGDVKHLGPVSNGDEPEKYAMEWNESQHPREAHKDNLENSWKHMTTDMKEFLVDGHYEALMGIDEQIEAARARKTAVQSNPNV